MELNALTIKQATTGLQNKEFSSVELTSACINRIKKRNSDINAFISVTEDEAMDAAKKADEAIKNGSSKTLTGIPFGVKDAICVKDIRSTGGAKILDTYTPPHTATVIEKILSEGLIKLESEEYATFNVPFTIVNEFYSGEILVKLEEKEISFRVEQE